VLLHCVAVCCIVLQFVALRCDLLPQLSWHALDTYICTYTYVHVHMCMYIHIYTFIYIRVYIYTHIYFVAKTQLARTGCNRISSFHTATHCNTPATRWTRSYLPRTYSTHCNTLQHIATHRNTLQHTATHRNTPQHTCDAMQ